MIWAARESATGSPEPTRTGASSEATASPPMDGSGYGDDRSQSEGCSSKPIPNLLSVPSCRKVVSDRRASLDRERDVNPAIRTLVRDEFARGASLRIVSFPEESTEIQDSPHLKLVIASPDTEWGTDGQAPEHIGGWTQERGTSPRLYPGSLVWCVKKPGRELHDRVELWLAWQRVEREVREGVLGTEFDHAERADIRRKVKSAEEEARDEVWAGYRFVAFSDARSVTRLRVIDLGAGHASASESLCGRIVGALKSEAILNESVGAGYIERHWPPALKEAGAWPLTGLRQSFLDGSLTRLVDPDAVLRGKIVEFVGTGTFGLASGSGDGEYHRVWHDEVVAPDDVVFEAGMFLLTKAKAKELRSPAPEPDPPEPPVGPPLVLTSETDSTTETQPTAREATLRLVGAVPPETWNRIGIKVLPKMRSGSDLSARIELSVTVDSERARDMESELRQILEDMDLGGRVNVERS